MRTAVTTINLISYDYPKAPRWINTEAGNWAWAQFVAWRSRAADALSVNERQLLLAEAERLMRDSSADELAAEELAA
jgi:hypothetical protein